MAIKIFGPEVAINEKTDAQYQCQFQEGAVGQPVLNGAAILTILATLKNVASDATINSRAAQNVLNANGGTLAGDGTFTLHLTGNLDNKIVNALATGSHVNEKHRLTLQVTFTKTGGGTGYLMHEVNFYVLSLEDVAN